MWDETTLSVVVAVVTGLFAIAVAVISSRKGKADAASNKFEMPHTEDHFHRHTQDLLKSHADLMKACFEDVTRELARVDVRFDRIEAMMSNLRQEQQLTDSWRRVERDMDKRK